MPDGNEQLQDEPGGTFAQLCEFAQRGAVLATPERIRVLGTRRFQRRRAGQAVLGTGGLAAVAFLGVGLAAHGSSHGPSALSVGASKSAASPAASHSGASESQCTDATGSDEFVLPSNGYGKAEAAFEAALERACFTHVTVALKSSATIAQGYVIDIVDARNHSVMGKVVASDAYLTLLVSTGPAH